MQEPILLNLIEKSLPKSEVKILIADDAEINQTILRDMVQSMGYQAIVVNDGEAALEATLNNQPDLILLDMIMPRMTGFEVLKRLKSDGILEKIPVIVISGVDKMENIASCIRIGAKDYLVKPFNPVLLEARILACLERKQARDREIQYYKLIEDFNEILEERVHEQVNDIVKAQVSMIFAMSKLAESRDTETGEHLERMREYSKCLCQTLQNHSQYKFEISDQYIEDIYVASPLHDIGKISIPDAILQKKGKLTDEEFEIMKTHPVIGAATLMAVYEKHPTNNFIRLGIEIAENHHEKWDGSGYPNGRAGLQIPLSGRILALADVYDALSSKRCYKEAFSHDVSRDIILKGKGKHFDPDIVDAFLDSEEKFLEIQRQFRDR